MLRDFASFRESQGKVEDAVRLRQLAAALSAETMDKMFQAQGDRAWFNIIFPPDSTPDEKAAGGQLTVLEMRHVVDFFSVTFGLCGIGQPGSHLCDFTSQQRAQLGNWFRKESLSSTWIRATSPMCNCSHSWQIPKDADATKSAAAASAAAEALGSGATTEDGPYPAYPTCQAGRPDHGSNGAYPSWPAFALEALCYVDGNCSSAFEALGTFAQATWEGPLGQAHEVPQLGTPPYTPFNDEPSFKPIAGVTRYIAIEGGSFFDAVLRGFFGFHAPLQWADANERTSKQEALDATLHQPEVPKGFTGTLNNLRTPFGLTAIDSGPTGLSIRLL